MGHKNKPEERDNISIQTTYLSTNPSADMIKMGLTVLGDSSLVLSLPCNPEELGIKQLTSVTHLQTEI